jgi:hypothetical protein
MLSVNRSCRVSLPPSASAQGRLVIRLAVALMLAAAGTAAGLLPYPATHAARADEVTISGGNLRDGWDSGESTGSLSPATLLSGSFGELFSTAVNGQVYAQPIIAGGTVIVATENDWVYGLDSATGAIKWSRSLGTPWPSSSERCSDLAPNVGVTGTPVYDPGTGTVYMVDQIVPPGGSVLQPVFHMDALNAQTGAEVAGWPVTISGAPVNDPTVPFNSFTELQRPGLLLLGGSVYAGFGSHCDFTPYDGYVVGVNTTSHATTMWSDEAGVTSTQAGIWQSGGGLLSDGAGRIFFASGNGVSPAPGIGTSPLGQLAESVVRLGVQSDGSLAAQDFFSPANAPTLDAHDTDFGSGGPMGLPFGTAALADLIVQIGKDGRAYVLNGTSLGGREQGPTNSDAVVSVSGPYVGQWGHPASFADTPQLTSGNVGTSSDYVYFVGKNSTMRYLRAFLGGSGGVTPVLSGVAASSDTFGYTSGSPVVTSNGTDPASAVVWVVNSSADTGATGMLEAFPAVPPKPVSGSCMAATPCTVSALWQFPLTGVGKFTTPATDSGRVYIATRGAVSNGSNCPTIPNGTVCGRVLGFGSPASAPLGGASPVNFGAVPVTTTSGATPVTVANTTASPVLVDSVDTSNADFAAGQIDVTPSGGSPSPVATYPVTLNPGDSLTANPAFTPALPGGVSGAVLFHTEAANFPVVSVGLSGTGTQAGFYTPTTAANFTAVPVGTTAPQQVIVTNDSTGAQTLTAPQPGAPFSVAGLPAPTAQIQPGASVTLTINYHPTAVTGPPDAGTLTLTGTDINTSGTTNTVISLSGTSAADTVPTLTAAPTSLSFGTVHLGQHAQQVITVTNSGNLPAIVTAAAGPPIPYGAPDPIASGLPVNPGSSVSIPITFAPASIGAVSASYHLTWTDVAGTHRLSIPISGTGTAPSAGIAVPPPGGGWFFNGSSAMSGTSLRLTPLSANRAGSAVYSVAVPSNGLKVTFTAQIGGGTGADGMALGLLDSSKTNPTAIGGSGAELGFGGLPGVAVTLDTSKDGSSYPSANFVGIATGVKNGLLTFAGTSTKVPNLRKGTHKVGVSVSGGKITVTVDGTQYLSKTVTLPPVIRLAFTGSTGTKTDRHTVSGVQITAGGHAIPVPGGGWSYNGSAGQSGPDTSLTPLVPNQAGAVIYPAPVQDDGLHVTFDLQISGGSGGEGMAFALLDPAKSTPSSVGGNGSLLGLGGMPGVSVILGTDPASPGWPKGQFIALSTGETGGVLVPQVASQGIGPLRSGTHIVSVSVAKNGTLGEVVTVFLDGVQVLQSAEPKLTATVRLAFTAGTSSLTDLHVVRNISVAASG